jgi:hypothetical protein
VKPLEGIIVVDLTQALAGPYGTFLLGALGARVVKVERPDGGDRVRSHPPYAGAVAAPPTGSGSDTRPAVPSTRRSSSALSAGSARRERPARGRRTTP